MKAPWAKVKTCIRPKIRVSPAAIRNSIMPMAMPATVRVSQVEKLIAGKVTSASTGRIA